MSFDIPIKYRMGKGKIMNELESRIYFLEHAHHRFTNPLPGETLMEKVKRYTSKNNLSVRYDLAMYRLYEKKPKTYDTLVKALPNPSWHSILGTNGAKPISMKFMNGRFPDI